VRQRHNPGGGPAQRASVYWHRYRAGILPDRQAAPGSEQVTPHSVGTQTVLPLQGIVDPES